MIVAKIVLFLGVLTHGIFADNDEQKDVYKAVVEVTLIVATHVRGLGKSRDIAFFVKGGGYVP
jgi:hypothetical protein